jgi:hypothetical protein
MTKIDLSDKAIAAALNRVLDEIAETARATSPTGRVSARLIGRVLALRLGGSAAGGENVGEAVAMMRDRSTGVSWPG